MTQVSDENSTEPLLVPHEAPLVPLDEFKNASWAMIHGWSGVILAIGIYCGFVVVALNLVSMIFGGAFSPIVFIAWLLVTIIVAAGLAAFGAIIAAFWSTVSISVILALNSFFGEVISPRMTVRLFGGVTGCLSTVWIALIALSSERYGQSGLVAVCAVIMFGAMLFGQIGGLWWAAYHDAWRLPKRSFESVIDGESNFQFGVRHILLGMAICSLVFTADAVFANNYHSHSLLILFCVYVFGQLVLIAGDRTLTRWGRESKAEKRAMAQHRVARRAESN